MKKLIIYSIILLGLAGAGCKKILDKVDFAGVPEAQVWNNVSTAQIYLDNLYQLCMPVFYSAAGSSSIPTAWHNISDECNGGSEIGVLQGTLTQESETDFYPTATSTWEYIRKINILISDIDGYGLTPAQTAPLKAQAYFLRAWTEFQQMKVYGGVPYVTNVENWETDSLSLPRNTTTQCVDSILADLAHCSILPSVQTGANQGAITSVAALALAGRVLLYYASPQFNPQNDGSRWQQAYQANLIAYDSLMNAGYALYPNYGRIFIDASLSTNKEPILFRAYSASSSISQQSNNWDETCRPFSQSYSGGGKNYNPSWNLVSAYPMADGYAPGEAGGAYPYDSIHFWQNRDPRFYQTIVYNGEVYGLGGVAARIQYTYVGYAPDLNAPTTTGFYCRRNIDTSISTANTQYGKCWWVEMRFGEVMMNLAECANATGNQAMAYQMLEAIRKRAGIPAGTGGLYGLAPSMSMAQMETAIINERRIEFAFEDKRYDDLRRTRTFDQLNGQVRTGFFIVPRKPYFCSTLKNSDTINPYNLDRYIDAAHTTMVADTINVNGAAYQTFFRDSMNKIVGEVPINFQTTYYAYGIPSADIGKDLNLQQTLGWMYAGAAGSFDPTK